ncbi:hypothetical protein [Streptomyces purpurogeneiscleroticus]|uniref:hypothetical protein n=1 Tax=Streptomyces purpurogeneiscleroticus TaxID=68259 RepID=UPI001CC038B5|nr:hypothetical protein [Streptomyces purpurogeneiscleroticus]MBZ4020822.1 hypothetical protein [Streptomyces purpurogeneiscleroticus]
MTDTGAPDQPARRHRRPDEASDEAVAAAGKFSEALETIERARGHLYSFHQLTGHADLALDEVVVRLREAGREDLAQRLSRELIGRNVLPGRWTFQIVEEYDEGYYAQFHRLNTLLHKELLDGRTHVFEAEMKERRRTHGDPAHRSVPEHEGPAS